MCSDKDGYNVYTNPICDTCLPYIIGGTGEMNKKNTAVWIYPNPVYSTGKIKFDNPDYAEARIVLYDIYGTLIYQYATNGNVATINAKDMKPGIYIYNIIHNSGSYYPGKIIILPEK